MNIDYSLSEGRLYSLHRLFTPPEGSRSTRLVHSGLFERTIWDFSGHESISLDRFPDNKEPSCCFLRLLPGKGRTVHFEIEGDYGLESCPSGGWLLKAREGTVPSYWIPRIPALRTLDMHDRILTEEDASILGFKASPGKLDIETEAPDDTCLDLVIWQFPAGYPDILEGLARPLTLEKQPMFFWSSQSIYKAPADVYLYLVHGHVYGGTWTWPRNWKFCSELDAYELYVTLSGLELATRRKLYSLLKLQVIFSVIARQAQDGGWYHGEWTDLLESHYRFHTGALLLLETALEEWPDDVIRGSLERGASFIASRTDRTDLGVWFLHDSLEDSPEAMDEMLKQTGVGAWKPSRVLGKSPTNKMILNTHVDTTVALDRYREVTGDNQYAEQVNSAVEATRAILNLRPAELLYRVLYRLVALILLPASEARKLPVAVRAVKRLTWKYLTNRLYLVKRAFPRLVMPGGFIDRHLSPVHFDAKYHAVNILDLTRLLRRFPGENIPGVLTGATKFVTDTSLLGWWADSHPRKFALVVWADALYHLYILQKEPACRQHLAEAIMYITDTQQGLPPSLLGANSEAVRKIEQIPCPSVADPRLRVVNLCHGDSMEILLVNPADHELDVEWEGNTGYQLAWQTAEGLSISPDEQLTIAPRGWILGYKA